MFFLLTACSQGVELTEASRESLLKKLGQKITVVGEANNLKLGALLHTGNSNIWIDGIPSWPKGYYVKYGKSKRLQVTGILVERFDRPVFIPETDFWSSPAGIPVPPGTDLKKASHRFLLKDATWEEYK